MVDRLEGKCEEIVARMKLLKARLESGDDSELLVWVLPGRLASAQRPLRHHPLYAGSGVIIPAQATPLLFQWADAVRTGGIAGIISFMHDRDRHCYSELALEATDINEFFEKQGFVVARIPWEDPRHSKADVATKRRNLERYRGEALAAFDILPKPVLLQCSSGIDRSAPVAAYIWQQRSAVYHSP
jgi:hypothetical protein